MRKNYEAQKSMKNYAVFISKLYETARTMTNISVVFPIFLHTFNFDHLQFAEHILPCCVRSLVKDGSNLHVEEFLYFSKLQ